MSRTPVRAALARLQEEKWVTIYPKRGALVNGLSDRDISEIADARYMLEASAAQRATAVTVEQPAAEAGGVAPGAGDRFGGR